MKTKKDFMSNYKTYDTSQGFGRARDWRKAFSETMDFDEAATILADQDATPYEILDVSKNATQAEIKSAYRRLMMIWHPDKNPHNVENATAMSRKIIAAFTTLWQGGNP